MITFEEIYNRLARAAKEKRLEKEIAALEMEGYKKGQLDCLLEPDKYAPIVKWEKCSCGKDKGLGCLDACKFGALSIDEDGNIKIEKEKCVGCGECEKFCKEKKFKINKELLPVLKALISKKGPIYAIVAPAFVGQFGEGISAGQVRNALKKIGFTGMIEVSLFADILTLKEALEFDKSINTQKDFLLTSCCCPVWLAMIKRFYKELVPHVPPSVSPMIAGGRTIKKFHKDATVVFIGPCLAKKSEAREPDVIGAVDYVLTFQEVKELFGLMDIDISECEEHKKEHSSAAGRIYARAGGVSEAVLKTLKKVRKHSKIELNARKAGGAVACKKMLDELKNGDINGNFFEGMGCIGGCVGGPRAIVEKGIGEKTVNNYAKQSLYETPADNPYVFRLLHKLGFSSIEELLEDKQIFTRNFD